MGEIMDKKIAYFFGLLFFSFFLLVGRVAEADIHHTFLEIECDKETKTLSVRTREDLAYADPDKDYYPKETIQKIKNGELRNLYAGEILSEKKTRANCVFSKRERVAIGVLLSPDHPGRDDVIRPYADGKLIPGWYSIRRLVSWNIQSNEGKGYIIRNCWRDTNSSQEDEERCEQFTFKNGKTSERKLIP
jgi:hypothetical protein